ncbi:MAG: hypothetical protein JWR89_643 [Tardiphaga sp.]|nr:hypothetical protein [Tardiphaga sp.]
MTLNRRTTFSALAALGLAATLAGVAIAPATAESNAQYCIARGGGEGAAGYTGNCVYSDYQQCSQAAADARGYCVQNIDYHGSAPASAPKRARRAR